MTTVFPHDILAAAETRLAPVRELLATLPPADAQRVRDGVCEALVAGDSIEAACLVSRVKHTAAARAEQAAAAKAKAEADAIDAMRAELLRTPHFVRLVHALAGELTKADTTPRMLEELADELPRICGRLRP
mgnify:CR=1 FL=1